MTQQGKLLSAVPASVTSTQFEYQCEYPVPAALLLTQLPGNELGKAAEDGPSIALATHRGAQDGGPDSRPFPGPCPLQQPWESISAQVSL